MRGSEWVHTLAEGKTPAQLQSREEAILQAVEASDVAPIEWIEVATKNSSHEGTLFVAADALRIGNAEDSIRVVTGAHVSQLIADELGCYLLTPHILDLVFKSAIRQITPCTQNSWADGSMAFTGRMIEHHEAIEEKLDREPIRHGLIDNVGKIWAITRKVLGKVGLAANYGWYVDSGALRAANSWAGRVHQSVGHAHNTEHVDYSQTIRLMKRTMILDGEEIDVADCARNPELASLVSHEGVLSDMRYPGILEAARDTDPAPAVTIIPETVVTPSPGFWDNPDNWGRAMEQGDAGLDVGGWQRVLLKDGHDLGSWKDDDDFGATTHNQTIAWQRARRLDADGVVGKRTRDKIGTPAIPRPMVPLVVDSDVSDVLDPVVTKDIPAKSWSKHRGTNNPKKWIVLHSMEAREASTTAENVAKWFGGSNPPKASAHYNIDDDSVVRSVPEGGIAWHAPGANREGIGFEHAGYARQSEAQWTDEFSTRMLRRSARLAAEVCKRHDIPARFVDREGLKRGDAGFTTHNEVTFAFRKSTHVDPGKHFPMEQYLTWVREALASL